MRKYILPHERNTVDIAMNFWAINCTLFSLSHYHIISCVIQYKYWVMSYHLHFVLIVMPIFMNRYFILFNLATNWFIQTKIGHAKSPCLLYECVLDRFSSIEYLRNDVRSLPMFLSQKIRSDVQCIISIRKNSRLN